MSVTFIAVSVVNCDELAQQLRDAIARLEALKREYEARCKGSPIPLPVPLPPTPECVALAAEIATLQTTVDAISQQIRENCDGVTGVVCRLLLKQIAPLDRQLSVLYRELGNRDVESAGPPRSKSLIMAKIKALSAVRAPILLAIRAIRCRYAPPHRPDSGVTLPDRH